MADYTQLHERAMKKIDSCLSNEGKQNEDHQASVDDTRVYSHGDLGFDTLRKFARMPLDSGTGLGMDFGGTLSKIVFLEPSEVPSHASPLNSFLLSTSEYGRSGKRDIEKSFYSDCLGGRLHFVWFESSRTAGAIRLMQKVQHNIKRVHATGGGAFKFARTVKEELGIHLMNQDEIQTVVRGIIFTLLERPNSECYTLAPFKEPENDNASRAEFRKSSGSEGAGGRPRRGSMHFDKVGISHVDALSYEMAKVSIPMPVSVDSFFPLLVVNIGSGVSIINVTGPNTFKRVSGTAVGGATYYGLCRLLLKCKSYDEAMDLAQLGDSRDVNLTVQDIYGGGYIQGNLPGEVTASFFGKCAIAVGDVGTTHSGTNYFLSFALFAMLFAFWGMVVLALDPIGILRNTPTRIDTEIIFWKFLACVFGTFVSISILKSRCMSTIRNYLPFCSNVKSFRDADVARALVVMVAQNVTQIAFLNAKEHKSKRVLFTGNFLRHNQIALRALCCMMSTWSRGEIEALFMEHEGYFGAIGAFLYSCGLIEINQKDYKGVRLREPCDRDQDVGSNSESISSDEGDFVDSFLFKGEFPRRRT